MMKTWTYLLITIATLILSLGRCADNDVHDQEVISLDDGKKWVVHDNMMAHIERMSVDVSNAGSSENKDYDMLNSELHSGIDALVSDCTMKGQAHDELHKWLVPFITDVNNYASDMTGEQKEDWFRRVERAMAEFRKYFE